MTKIIGVALVCVGALLAQDGNDRIQVPLSDPSRPPRIQAHLISGGITVRGADTKQVTVEVEPDGHRHRTEVRNSRADGMKRLDLPGNSGIDVTEENNVVTIKSMPWKNPGQLVITVPKRSSLQLKSINNGGIYVEHVDGEIDVNELNGTITLKNVAGSVIAHSLNGEVTASLDRIDPSKPMSFSTLNGNIDITLPADARASLRMRTDNGEIYSDFDVKLDSGSRASQLETDNGPNGSHHIRLNHTVHGTINGGGSEFQFTSFNGQIYIRKAK